MGKEKGRRRLLKHKQNDNDKAINESLVKEFCLGFKAIMHDIDTSQQFLKL
jgi:hypothetical protein